VKAPSFAAASLACAVALSACHGDPVWVAQGAPSPPVDPARTGDVVTPEPAEPLTPAKAPAGAIADAVDVAAGEGTFVHNGCHVTRAGEVMCWGGPNVAHYVTQRGVPMRGPVRVPGIESAARVWMGAEGHCVLLRDRSARCWKGLKEPSNPGPGDLVKVTLGSNHACGLTTDGKVYCWGNNLNGALGDPALAMGVDRGAERVGLPGGAEDPVVDIDASGYGTCAAQKSGALVCWGAHPFLPYSSAPSELAANTAPRVIPNVTGARRVEGGGLWVLTREDHILRLTPKYDTRGRREGVTREEASLPGVADIAGGGDTLYAIGKDGRVYAWGAGPMPRTMDNEASKERNKRRSRFAAIPGLGDVRALSATGTHACAVTNEGHVRCWGENDLGDLGDGSLARAETPTFVIDYRPSILPEPPGGVGHCTADKQLRTTCAVVGEECFLVSPPGYWAVETGGAMCGKDCQEHVMETLKGRAIPACMCTCSDDYKAAEEKNRRSQPEGPLP